MSVPCRMDWNRGGRRLGLALLLLPLALAGVAAVAQATPPSEPDDTELRAALTRQFEVLPLSSGVILKPRSERDYRVIEITRRGVAVDGEPLDPEELGERLVADDHEVLADLLELPQREQRRLLEDVAAGGAAPRRGAEPAAPPPPPVPPAPGVEAVPGGPPVAEPPEPPEPAEPPEPRRRRHTRSDAKVAVGSHVHVREDEISDEAVAVGGSVTVDGEVRGDAVAVGGTARINGRVTGNAVAVGGSVRLGPRAEVEGDVTSVGGRVERDPSAKVGGKVSEVAFGSAFHLGLLRDLDIDIDERPSPFRRFTEMAVRAVALVIFGLLNCLVLLLARAPVERVGQKIAQEPWRAGLAGLLSQVLFIPLLVVTVVILAVSIIGIPLLVLVPFALVALVIFALVGYTSAAQRLGLWAERRFGWRSASVYWTLLVGVGLIQIWTFVGHFLDWGPLGFLSVVLMIIGFLIQYLAWTIGFGGVLLTRFATGSDWSGRRRPPAPLADEPPLDLEIPREPEREI